MFLATLIVLRLSPLVPPLRFAITLVTHCFLFVLRLSYPPQKESPRLLTTARQVGG